jgi:hypothetical protein
VPTAADLLSDLTSSPGWPPRWMTVAEVAAELARLGFWEQPPFRGYTGKARLDFLTGILSNPDAGGDPTWVQMGPRFKHSALLTEEDHALIREWLDERRAAFNEDLSRILLGEPLPWREGANAPAIGPEDFLRQARPLIEELAQLARQLEWGADLEQARARTGEMPPEARHVWEITTALRNVLCSIPTRVVMSGSATEVL